MIELFLEIDPPTATAQEKKVRIIAGHPQFYDAADVKKAKALLKWEIQTSLPSDFKTFEGPVKLTEVWRFKAKTHKNLEYRVSRPDTDNLSKGLKDVMTHIGIWKDDSQVVEEKITKVWADVPGILLRVEELPKYWQEEGTYDRS